MSKPKPKIALAVVGDTPDLRKAVEAIAIKPKSGRLTLLTRKLFNILLAKAQAQGIENPKYSLSLSELGTAAAFDSSDTEMLKEHLRKMVSTTVEWAGGAKGSRRWGITNLVGSVELIEHGQRCTIEWSYAEPVKGRLLAPNVYARLSLQFQNSFRSAAALALYEICVRYADSPGQLTMRMPWEEWRPVLTGTPDSSREGVYHQYKYFKRDVIKPAVAEINGLSVIDLEVALIEHKAGRSVTEIQFSVLPRQQKGLAFDETNIFDMALVSRMMALGLSKPQAERIYADNEENRVRAALDYVEKRLKQKPPIDNVPGYFRKALTEGYGEQALGAAKGAQAKAADGPKPQIAGAASASKTIEKLMEAWRDEQRLAVRAQFDAGSEDEQRARLDAFVASGIPPHLAAKWRKSGLQDKMCAVAFLSFLMRGVQEPSRADLLEFGWAKGLISA